MHVKKTVSDSNSEIEVPTYSEVGEKRSQDVAIQEGMLAGIAYNYVALVLSVTDTVETWTYKTGGASGTIVATVVITYLTSSRDVIVSVLRTV